MLFLKLVKVEYLLEIFYKSFTYVSEEILTVLCIFVFSNKNKEL